MKMKKVLASLAVATVSFVGLVGMAQAADNAAAGSGVVAADVYAGDYAGEYAAGNLGAKGDSYAGDYSGKQYAGNAYAGKQVKKLSQFTLSAYAPNGTSRSLSEVRYGDTLVLEGLNKDNAVRSYAVEIHSNVVKLGTFTAQPGKGIRVEYKVSAKDLEVGKHHIYNTYLGAKDDTSEAEFNIVGETAKGSSLPNTGSVSLIAALLSLAALGTGTAGVAIRRQYLA